MNAKEQAKHLIEQLPEGIVRGQVVEFLEFLQEKQRRAEQVMRAMAELPDDDEPTTAEDLEAIREADEAIARGEVMPLEDLERELGL